MVDDLPLSDLDRHLWPVRRLLAWALARPERVAGLRHIEANTARWLDPLAGTDLPEPLAASVSELRDALRGADTDPAARLPEAWSRLVRLDALLGLPLHEVPPEAPRLGEQDDLSPHTEELADTRDESPAGPDDEPEPEVRSEARTASIAEPGGLGRPIPGLDPELQAALAEEGVETVADLLLLAPAGYETVRPVHGAGRDLPLGRIAVGGRVQRRCTVFTPSQDGPKARPELVIVGAGPLRVAWTNRAPDWLLGRFPPDARVVLVGEHAEEGGSTWLLDPEPAVAESHAVHLARYALEGVPDEAVRALVWRHLPEIERARDPLPADMLGRVELVGLAEAVRDVHTRGPAHPEARKRLAFDEALLAQMGLAHPRFGSTRERGIAHPILNNWVARTTELLERSLDDQQQSAFEDIKRDLHSGTPMSRVLCGEAGSGKTWVALLSLLMVCETKLQGMWLCPDDRTAERRLIALDPVFKELGLVARHLTGDPSRNQRDALRRGEIHVVIGSSALLDADLEFRRLGLLVAEEVPAFVGTAGAWGRTPARAQAMKPPRPDLLVLSHTPIPSAILLTAFGECDLSIVDSARAVPAPKCSLFAEGQRDEAYARLRDAVAASHQGYVLFPSAPDGTDLLDYREAMRLSDVLERDLWPEAADRPRVGVLHGSQTPSDRAKILDDFRHRRIAVLASTIPVEAGSPAARVAIVEQADRFDSWSLLRIRGLVQSPAGSELLLVASPTPLLEGLVSGWDGWAVVEWELEQRGQTALLAREVPAAVRLRWALPKEDRDLLLLAREEAHRLLEADPQLRRPAHQDLARVLRDRWEDLLTLPAEPSAGGPAGAGAARKRRRRRKKK